ncbi:WD40/YVTN/BNR-like repeat-containing protein [Tunturibacter empetritectus]|uniref:Photosystem II stability/assembly factor-like uncharacterized protein n=2 Tax=Tunturiibacter empetritectus TaxID=3069691 RepID=A0A7W8MPF1_9BACT|nr:hypothetical protein [Edaphobacter lichenicola]MBB5315373.1 photosystem II stability/assembly factor-like uncharacterized protein [Edaphobacter lichenicola]
MSRFLRLPVTFLAVLVFLSCFQLHAASWLPYGPDGGDARAFAIDPHDHTHMYLGTATGWMYESHNSGGDWKRLAWIGKRDDLVLDSIVVSGADSKQIVVGAWVLGSPDGGIFLSKDGGLTWQSPSEMQGQSIRALTAAPSNPKTLVAGTLKGVYQSADGGDHWKLISPAGSQELHEVESIALDPVDPQIIYAGTWHLPWKTVDGGQHWTNIKQGVIDDSDVFSIIVDPKDPKTVYASACSGIYKSQTGGDLFKKVQGIPSTARRTRVLMQDPTNSNIVFAGTTEGLWRTVDSGATWQRTTGPEVIINDVFVDPTNSNRVMLATDRGGVLASNDGGNSFVQSNNGFSARQITSYLADASTPGSVYVGVVNDKALGGVFASTNGGLTWSQTSSGLNGHDVFSLAQGPDGALLAGTRHGIYRLQGATWSRVDNVTLNPPPAPPSRTGKKTAHAGAASAAHKSPEAVAHKSAALQPVHSFEPAINAFARGGDTLYAATSSGLFESATSGQSWKEVPGFEPRSWNFVAARRSTVLASNLNSAVLSLDGGQQWTPIKLPETLDQLSAMAVDDAGGLWVGGRQGIYVSDDKGATWQTVKDLFLRDVNSIFYDDASQRVLIAAGSKNTIAFAVHLPDRKIHYWNTGWNLRLIRPMGDHLVGTTWFDGVVIQPRMVDSKEMASH